MNSFKEKFKIAKILASLFTHSSTPEEEKNYHAWLDENPEHQKIADRILNKETYEENSRLIKSFSSQKAWEKVYPLLGGNQSGTVFSWKKSLKYAALILLLLVPASYFIYHWISEETISDITPGTLGGELILSDGKSFNLSDNNFPENAVRAFVIDSKGINYQIPANKPQVKEIQNTLRTLQGMECLITLSDGTRVHLNAETRLTYPVCFSSKERIVQIEGEAYFDVAKDHGHPFVVKTEEVEVKVLGTVFNVNAYPEGEWVRTTLVEGKVEAVCGGRLFVMEPGMQVAYSKGTGETEYKKVDTHLFTSWKDGYYEFEEMELGELMPLLGRWYAVGVDFEEPELKRLKFSGRLQRYETVADLVKMLEYTGDVVFEVKNDRILVRKR